MTVTLQPTSVKLPLTTNKIRVQNEDGDQVMHIDGSGEGYLKIRKESLEWDGEELRVTGVDEDGNPASVTIDADTGRIMPFRF